MAFKSLKIGKHIIDIPIVQGGMGVGISWDKLAGNVSKEGGLGVISSVGTGYYENKAYVQRLVAERPLEVQNFYSKDALFKIFENARKICGDKPLACNVLYAINDYGRVVTDACEAGANIIITGAGLPTNMPEFTADYPDVALVPIVSSAKALKIICKRWEKRYGRLPDAVILEGPKSGGHQGFTYEQCALDENQLENLVKPVVEEAALWGGMPVIAAGGVWDKADIEEMLSLGASGVQMGTRFIGTHECDAHSNFKDVLLGAKEEDIVLMGSPVGYPARGVRTNLTGLVERREGPAIKCISNCVAPCHRGVEAKEVGFCIADRLSDAYEGNLELGLFFSGTNGYRITEIISVKELMQKLTEGE
jgi:nitronate monooxygenase